MWLDARDGMAQALGLDFMDELRALLRENFGHESLRSGQAEVIGPLMLGAQRVAKAVRAALNPDGIVITQFNGAPAGQTVFHLHVHIIPRWEGVALGRHGQGMADMEKLKVLAAQIAIMLLRQLKMRAIAPF